MWEHCDAFCKTLNMQKAKNTRKKVLGLEASPVAWKPFMKA